VHSTTQRIFTEWFYSFFKAHQIPAISITTKATSPFKTAPINPRSLLSDTGALRLWWFSMPVVNLLVTISYLSWVDGRLSVGKPFKFGKSLS